LFNDNSIIKIVDSYVGQKGFELGLAQAFLCRRLNASVEHNVRKNKEMMGGRHTRQERRQGSLAMVIGYERKEKKKTEWGFYLSGGGHPMAP